MKPPPPMVQRLAGLVALASEDGTQVRPLKLAVAQLSHAEQVELLTLAATLIGEHQGLEDLQAIVRRLRGADG